MAKSDVQATLKACIAKFDPATARVIRASRKRLRAVLPTANEIVYDNYNFFVIGYSPTLRPSDTIVSLAAAANGVGLSFYRGATLPDPQGMLLGTGKQNRFVRLPTAEVLAQRGVKALILAAIRQSKVPLPDHGHGTTLIKSVSAKQRPRRKKMQPECAAVADADSVP
ncbi:MAG TPA: hypothetical protein VJS12_08985 [Steroidobacteraceae bacterium]|nr:hypothetical protein [Steroidobacteraceae bacterium]